MHKILKILTSRLFIVVPLVIAQLVFFVLLFREVAVGMQLEQFLSAASVILAILVINRWEDPSYRIGWLFIILGIPIIGIPLYILAGNRKVPAKLANGTIAANRQMVGLLENDPIVLGEGAKADPNIQNIFWYGYQASGFPIYEGTTCKYYPSGEAWLPDYIAELKKAKHFIFMEYFIIDKGSVWDEILAVLKQKAAEGVEVKVIYDDFGSITLPVNYDKKLKAMGIEAYRFNKVHPAFIIQMNNRDHRKIAIIDHKEAFTGGMNLADEYANDIVRFGYWKDAMIKIEGPAIKNLIFLFLSMFDLCQNQLSDYDKYLIYDYQKYKENALVTPFGDGPAPFISQEAGEATFVNMIENAKERVYICTPYFIPTENLKSSIIRAGYRGIDVRILLPGIPDKGAVYKLATSYFKELIKAGIKVYTYNEGFNHQKSIVVDGKIAFVGTINMDYRSLIHHFECGAIFIDDEAVKEVEDDLIDCYDHSELVSKEKAEISVFTGFLCAIMKVFAQLL